MINTTLGIFSLVSFVINARVSTLHGVIVLQAIERCNNRLNP